MEEPLHEVMEEELPVLRNWLQQFLPESQKMYGTVDEQLKGKWRGTRYLTLGWPDILAVGEGDVYTSTCKCPEWYNHVRSTSVFSPNPTHIEALLTRPEFLDWTKPIIFVAIPSSNGDVVHRISNATGTKFNKRFCNYLMEVTAENLIVKPVPDGYELRPLDPDLHADYVTSTWPHRRKYTNGYVYELIKNQPSFGLFDSNGQCVALELTSEYGFGALLYVREEARGRGLGKVVASHLARELLKDHDKVYAGVIEDNISSIETHRKIGFKIVGKVDWYVHSMQEAKIVSSQ